MLCLVRTMYDIRFVCDILILFNTLHVYTLWKHLKQQIYVEWGFDDICVYNTFLKDVYTVV